MYVPNATTDQAGIVTITDQNFKGMKTVYGAIRGYIYNLNKNAPAFIFDKPGSYWTGIGANEEANTILFAPCQENAEKAGGWEWVANYNQIWKFQGDIKISNNIFLTNNIYLNADNSHYINSSYYTGTSAQTNRLAKQTFDSTTIDQTNTTGLLFGTISGYTGPGFGSNDAMIIHMSWNAEDKYGAQIALDDTTTPNMYIRNRATNWSAWAKVLLSTNYTDYTVTKTGSGASGNSWAIGITGNAATASKITDLTTNDQASSADTWRRIWFCYTDNATGRPAYDDRFVIQTSTGTLKAPTFLGNLSGNASTATAFASAKSIALTGDVTGSASSTGGWSITTTSNQLSYPAVIGTQEALDAFKTNNKFKVGYWNGFTPTNLFSNGIVLSGGWTSDAYGWQIAIDDDPTYKIALRQKSTTWSSWKYLAMSDGSNASGDWAIRTRGLYSNGPLTTIEDTDAFIEGNTVKYATVTTEGTSIANDGMIISIPYTGTSWGAQIWLDDGSSAATMQIRNRNGSGWNPWRKVLCDGDLSNYVTLTTTQSISGAKTFATDVTISNSLYPSIIFKNTQNARKSVFEGSYVGSSILWAYSASGDNRRGIAINTADYQSDVKNALWLRTCVDGTWSQYQIITSVGGQTINGSLTASSVYGAVWNDYAEFRETKETIEAGRVVIENGDDTLSLATERLMPGANIVSDTFGFAIGETDNAKTPLAVSGRALVYTYEDRDSYKAGDPVCSGPNGTVSKMTREEVMMYSDRMIGTVSSIPDYETWGTGNVSVNNRIWVKVV